MSREMRLGVVLFVALASGLGAQEPGGGDSWPPLSTHLPEQSQRTVDYLLTVALDEDGHTLDGISQVTWRNTTGVPTAELFWHVYNNAWSRRDSVWLSEARLLQDHALPRRLGGTEIHGVSLIPAEEGAQRRALDWTYWDPESRGDQTVMRVSLPSPVAPGDSVTVAVDFTADMPPAFRRSGGDDQGGYLHAAQWFPKLGVLEERDGQPVWVCPAYHYLTEFYADYGNYTVILTLPSRYGPDENGNLRVAASGSLRELKKGNGSITCTFVAEDVHDFAWTADPDFQVFVEDFDPARWQDHAEERRVARALGRRVEDVRPRPTQMILMIQPEHLEYTERYRVALEKSLYYFSLWYGQYPYETISLVDPAHNARATGGMEYPRLITGSVSKGMAERTLDPEGVTVHEFGHQYWYGLVGNNEFLHAWLDEGFCTHASVRVEKAGWPPELSTYSLFGRQFYGRAPLDLPDYGRGDARALLTLQRWESPDLRFVGPLSFGLRRRTELDHWLAEVPAASYLREVENDAVWAERPTPQTDWVEPIGHHTYRLLSRDAKGNNSYSRMAATLETMAGLMGEDRWTRVMRAYHETLRFRHARPVDFRNVLLEYGAGAALSGTEEGNVVAIDWDDFWEQAIYGNETVDFAVTRLANQRAIADPRKLPLTDPRNPSVADGGDPGESKENWQVLVEVRRLGGFRVPVEIRLDWDNGTTTTYAWDGQAYWWRFAPEPDGRRVVQVTVDPVHRLLLDRDWSNNSRLAEPETRRARNAGVRALIWAQQVLHYFGGAG